MKKILLPLLVVVLLFSSVPAAEASPHPDQTTATEIIYLINIYRAEKGLYAYVYNATLAAVAQSHAEYQASIDTLTHTGAGGTTSSQRVAAAGYGGGEYIVVNEMIYGGGYATPQAAVTWWKGSPIHNAIMLSDEYHEIGVGVASNGTTTYYTVNVASIPGVTSPGSGSSGEVPTAVEEESTPVETAAPGENGSIFHTEEEGLPRESTKGSGLTWLVIIGLVIVLGVGAFFLLRETRGEVEEEDLEVDEDEKEVSVFTNLPRDEQVVALQYMAEEALEAYPLEVVKIEPLRYILNAEYIVTARKIGDSGPPKRYVLRVNAPGFQNRDEIRSELEWLHAINQETDLTVPNPMRTREGKWVVSVDTPVVPEERYVTLFDFIPGHTIEDEVTTEHMEVVGAFVSRLHQHGANFIPPAWFTRKHWDIEGLTGGMLDVPAEKAYAALDERERRIIDAAEKLVRRAMDHLGQPPAVYGLIHGDLHHKSYLFHEGKPFVLDFDTCGYGYYIYDLSVALWDLFDRPDFALFKNAMLKGYRKFRPLSIEEEELIIHFMAGRLMTLTLAWAGRRDTPGLREMADRAIARQVKLLETVLRMFVE